MINFEQTLGLLSRDPSDAKISLEPRQLGINCPMPAFSGYPVDDAWDLQQMVVELERKYRSSGPDPHLHVRRYLNIQ